MHYVEVIADHTDKPITRIGEIRQYLDWWTAYYDHDGFWYNYIDWEDSRIVVHALFEIDTVAVHAKLCWDF